MTPLGKADEKLILMREGKEEEGSRARGCTSQVAPPFSVPRGPFYSFTSSHIERYIHSSMLSTQEILLILETAEDFILLNFSLLSSSASKNSIVVVARSNPSIPSETR